MFKSWAWKPQLDPLFDVGFDDQLVGNWFFNIDAKQMLLNQRAHLNDSPNRMDARTPLNPTVVMGVLDIAFNPCGVRNETGCFL